MILPNGLLEFVKILSDWVDQLGCIEKLYLIGSRVRGDHHQKSDVDVHIVFDYAAPDDAFARWMQQNSSLFEQINSLLPGPLALHQEPDDIVVPKILEAAKSSAMTYRRVICVNLPPSPFSKLH